MHEIRIAEDLAQIVLDTARENGLSVVSSVNVSFGSTIQIVPEIFRFAFAATVKDTIAEKAMVSIEILPLKLKCFVCGTEWEMDEKNFKCQTCGSTDLKILQGKELFIKSIEGE